MPRFTACARARFANTHNGNYYGAYSDASLYRNAS